MERGDDPVVNDGQSVEMPVEEDDQLVEGTDVEHDESLDEEHLDLEYNESGELVDGELDIEHDEF